MAIILTMSIPSTLANVTHRSSRTKKPSLPLERTILTSQLRFSALPYAFGTLLMSWVDRSSICNTFDPSLNLSGGLSSFRTLEAQDVWCPHGVAKVLGAVGNASNSADGSTPRCSTMSNSLNRGPLQRASTWKVHLFFIVLRAKSLSLWADINLVGTCVWPRLCNLFGTLRVLETLASKTLVDKNLTKYSTAITHDDSLISPALSWTIFCTGNMDGWK